MKISRCVMSSYSKIPCLNKSKVTDWLALEHSKWCPADKKIEWVNNWINKGGHLPNKDDYSDPKFMHVAAAVREDRERFWAGFSGPSRIGEITKKALKLVEAEKGFSRIAVDLGGGNSSLALWLLSNQWKVVVVDSSPLALRNLALRVNQHKLNLVAQSNLTLVCQNMENYTFPSNVNLVVAQSSFPYSNPSRFEQLWDRIYGSLGERGRIVGNLFCYPHEEERGKEKELIHRLKYGAWYVEKPIVEAILQNKGYEIVYCSFDEDENARGVDFIGCK